MSLGRNCFVAFTLMEVMVVNDCEGIDVGLYKLFLLLYANVIVDTEMDL